jgi:DNA modification methylase
MSQGAWMTGFYIGETYLENNVLLYFENRLEKIIKGKNDYLRYFNQGLFNDYNNTYQVTQFDAKKLQIQSESIDYVFTDPPYGDAVPYFEQSVIWNSWLKFQPNYSDEIVISDSKTRKKDIESFESEIYEAFSEIRRVLKLGGYFSLTYHSLSGLEWRAITNACIKNGFKMVGFNWLVQKSFTPRQINRSKSIKGDVLITFRKTSSIRAIVKTDSETESLYIQRIHNWLKNKPLDTNEVFLNIMKMIFEENILIGDIDLLDVLSNHFTFNENQQWTIKQEIEVDII